mgnify:CR=1 FL=1
MQKNPVFVVRCVTRVCQRPTRPGPEGQRTRRLLRVTLRSLVTLYAPACACASARGTRVGASAGSTMCVLAAELGHVYPCAPKHALPRQSALISILPSALRILAFAAGHPKPRGAAAAGLSASTDPRTSGAGLGARLGRRLEVRGGEAGTADTGGRGTCKALLACLGAVRSQWQRGLTVPGTGIYDTVGSTHCRQLDRVVACSPSVCVQGPAAEAARGASTQSIVTCHLDIMEGAVQASWQG